LVLTNIGSFLLQEKSMREPPFLIWLKGERSSHGP